MADPVRLRGFNEAQHRILEQLAKIVREDEARYPDDVFAGILRDQLVGLGLDLGLLTQVLQHSAHAEIARGEA